MTALSDRQEIVEGITQARAKGARLAKCCEVVGIDRSTWKRWHKQGKLCADARPEAQRPVPTNALSAQEREQIVAECLRPGARQRSCIIF